MRGEARNSSFEWQETHEEQSQVLTHGPGDQDEQGNHSCGNLNRRTDRNSDRNLHLSRAGLAHRSTGESFTYPLQAIQTEVTCSAAFPTKGKRIRPMNLDVSLCWKAELRY